DHLGPLFKENGVKTLIWCWDHNWNKPEVPRTILSDPLAAQYIDGTGFHHYEGKVQAQSALKAEFPEKHIYFTEGSVFRPRGAVMIANILRNWSRSYSAWVIMLDEHRKPNRGPHSASATIIELKDTGAVEYRNDYYLYGQFMKFIPRGAVRVESDTPEGKRLFSNVAFRTPDGKMVLIAANAERNNAAFSVQCGEKAFDAALPPGAVATYVWTPAR
ncbi:MAG TPA: glycoside hydrolase family 30 beta sandwich domain-containing protein, partial [Candidatus Hydrogenedentes bacterium]|nr:glycoside hydrolase family 30 beta sandwich domain-containing protein [Candidatus Hydrogenedentota bacterium]